MNLKFINYILFAFLIVAAVNADSICQWGDPQAVWPLNSSTTLNDCSGHDRDLVNSGTIIFPDDAAIFPDNGHLEHTNTSFAEFGSGSFTLCLNASYNNTDGAFVSHYNLGSASGWWGYADNLVRFAVGATSGERANLPATTDNNNWYTYCFVRNTTHVAIHTDGRYNTSETNNNNANSGQVLRFGDSSSNPGGGWKLRGKMRDVVLFDYAFSNTNVSDYHARAWDASPLVLTRPIITDINLTSGNPPIGDNSSPYQTNDTTPTFTFTTDVDSNCSISDTNNNYTDMGNTRLCSGGQGTTSHTCTMIAADALSFGTDAAYISCINLANPTNETTGATSGELVINVKPTIDIIFIYSVYDDIYSNKTFSEGQKFNISINLSANGQGTDQGSCNISVINGILEEETEGFTLCNTGCDYDTFTWNVTFDTLNSKNDSVRFDVCHNGSAANADLSLEITCDATITGFTYDNLDFPFCIVNNEVIIENLEECSGKTDIKIELSNNAAFPSRHYIDELEYDREYYKIVDELSYIPGTGLYQSNNVFEYYIHGIKDIYGNCSSTNFIYVGNESDTIIIEEAAPEIFHNFIVVDGNQLAFNDLVTVPALSTSNITVYMAIVDDDLINHTVYIYNSTGFLMWNETIIGEVSSHSHTLPVGLFIYNDTFNFTTIARDFNLTSNLTTRFTTQITPNAAPIITFGLPDGYSSIEDVKFNINYTPNDGQIIDNCTLHTNLSGSFALTTLNTTISKATVNLFNMTVYDTGRYIYQIRCTDNFGLTGTTANRSFIITAGSPTGYNISTIESIGFFNTDAFDVNTIPGMLVFIFIFLIVVAMIIFAEVLQIPIFGIIAAFAGIAYGILIYITITAFIGIIFIMFSLFYMIRSLAMAR